MPSVSVRVEYSSTGGVPTSTPRVSVQVSAKPPTESELYAAISKRYLNWNFIMRRMAAERICR